jgi:hypothetical protein
LTITTCGDDAWSRSSKARPADTRMPMAPK